MNRLSNLSYTNKDFNSIYTELLQYAKDISYRWDPTVSDESDPGVVLLKLAAILGDKDNYNIDQNILELFPASVSQPAAARQLFEQCGYSMRHYQAAEGVVNIMFNKYTGTPSTDLTHGVKFDSATNTVSIEKFTMLTDADNSVVYTITDRRGSLSLHKQEPVPVLEGTATQYIVSNNADITVRHLDSLRRLYFTELDVAENGIFISSIDDDDITWNKVDNLSVQPLGSYCFKFGVTADNSACYVEFPEDVASLFGSGINITYIRTTGSRGNIAARKLSKFFANPADGLELVVTNPLAILNGSDPETIDDAYKSYRRVKDTFETLVSLKDYTDYMIANHKASNGYVCDRTNDPQRVSKVLETLGGSTFLTSVVDNIDSVPAMSAFDLCFYALEYVSSCKSTTVAESEAYFKKSFKLIDPTSSYGRHIFTGDDLEDEVKSLQHDFKDFETDKILMIKNKYPIKTTIIPRYKLSIAQQMEVSDNVRFALYEALKSSELTFGVAPEYDYVYEAILTADERIKAIALDYPTYQTFVVYRPASATFELREVRVDSAAQPDASTETLVNTFRQEIRVKNILNGTTPIDIKEDSFVYGVSQTAIEKYNDVKTLTTSAKIELTSGVQYTVQPNEAIIFSTDSLVEENKFSNYVKVLCKFTNNASVTGYHSFKDYEYIVFFWQEKSTDDVYTYIKYDNSTDSAANLFYTNVELATSIYALASDWGGDLNNLTASSTPQKLTSGSTLNAEIKKLSLPVGSTSTTNDAVVLTGTDCVTTYKTNSVVVNNGSTGTSNIYWIRNKTVVDNNGRAFFELFENNTVEYTLQSGEYFLYTNPEKTLLHVVGEGTKIKRSESLNITWRCNPIEYSSITDIDVLEDYWISISNSNQSTGQLTLTEQQIVVLGPDCEVTVTVTDPPNKTWELLNEDVSLDAFSTITYVDRDGIQATLPNYESSSFTWKAKSRLDLNVSSNKPQFLETTHSVTIPGTDEPISGKYIQTSRDVQIVGGTNIDTTRLAGLKILEPISILAYSAPETSTSGNIKHNLNTLASTVVGRDEITVPAGHYLMSVRKQTADNSTSSPLKEKTGDPQSEITPVYMNSIGTHFVFEFKFDSNTEIIIGDDNTSSSNPLTIEPFYNCSSTTTIDSSIWEKLQLKGGDVNFDPIVSAQNARMVDPCSAEAFLDPTHAYNKFTICEWQESDTTSGSDIKVVTNVR